MKKGNKIKDERIIQLNNKIQSEAFILVITLLSISIMIKAYILDMAFPEYITELVVLIISIIYITVRGSIMGYSSMDTSNQGKKLYVFSVIGLSLLITIINGIRNYSLYGDKYTGIFDSLFLSALLITFVSSVLLISIILLVVAEIEKIGQNRLEKKLENDEE